MLQILAVALLDHVIMGHDVFFVQEGPDEVVQYEVHKSGTVTPITKKLPKISVIASVEKFNHGYLIDPPIQIASTQELVKYLGKFEPVTATEARLIR